MKIFKNYTRYHLLSVGLFRACGVIALLCCAITGQLLAQSTELLKSIPVNNIEQLSIDRYNHIYAVSSTGEVLKFDSLGKEIVNYSPNQNDGVDLIEAWQTVQIFLFYEELQAFSLCDRFLGTCVQYTFPESLGYITKATLASDGNLWLFDQDDFSIKKYSTKTRQVILSNPLNLVIEEVNFSIHFMREYQNKLYLITEHNLYQFDVFGNFEKGWKHSNHNPASAYWFGFYQDRLYYISGLRLNCYNLYNTDNESVDSDVVYKQVVWVNKSLLLGLDTTGNKLDWLRIATDP